MSDKTVILHIDERWYKALNCHLKDETLEKHMEDVLDELCDQLPPREYERISREIWLENPENRQMWEAGRRFTVLRLTENGESVYFSVETSVEMLEAANYLRRHIPLKNILSKFAAAIPYSEKITKEQFEEAAAEHMKHPDRVTGVYELNFDKRTFTALDSADGWQAFEMKDMKIAAYFAMRKRQLCMENRRDIFLGKLDGKELPVSDRLTMHNFHFEKTIEVMDEGKLCFYLVPDFNVGKAFDTSVEGKECGLYAAYNMITQSVCNELEIAFFDSIYDEDRVIPYQLNAVDKAVLLKKMEAYCMEQEHTTLVQFSEAFLQEPETVTQEMQMC